MTTITRRAALGALASIPTVAGTTVAFALPAVSQPPDLPRVLAPTTDDPLLNTIRAYRDGLADFNANAAEEWDQEANDSYAAATFRPPMESLSEWSEPAKTHKGAVEALRLIAEENALYAHSPLVGPMLAAAVAYLEVQS